MILDDLSEVIRSRRIAPEGDSYVSSLFARGRDEILKKIGEEAAEVIIAAKNNPQQPLVHEMADLWFHCMVLLDDAGISHNDVFRELSSRFGKRGAQHE